MTARITFGSRTINFRLLPYILEPDEPRSTIGEPSASGVVETLNVRANGVILIAIRNNEYLNATDATMLRNVEQWESLARKGVTPWFISRDSAEQKLTTLDDGEAAGSTVIGLASTTSIVVGNKYVIESKIDSEPVKVLSIDPGVSVTVVEPILFDYAVGARFRSAEYWPARLAPNTKSVIVHRRPKFFDVVIPFVKDVNTIT